MNEQWDAVGARLEMWFAEAGPEHEEERRAWFLALLAECGRPGRSAELFGFSVALGLADLARQVELGAQLDAAGLHAPRGMQARFPRHCTAGRPPRRSCPPGP